MPHIRCPQCGAVSDTRAPDYPFCAGCQENLARCGYCRWFDEHAVGCTNPEVAGEFEVSRGAAPPCGQHTPRGGMHAPRHGLALIVALGLAAAAFALAYGFIVLLQPVEAPATSPVELQLRVEADIYGARVEEPYRVTAEIYNASDVVAGGIRFRIAREFLGHFTVRQITPRPLTMGATGSSSQWTVLSYPNLNPREQRTIVLELVPREAGVFHLILQVAWADSARHVATDLPIRVKAARGGLQQQAGSEKSE